VSVAQAVPTVRRSMAEGWATCPAFVMERSERLAFGQAVHTFISTYWRHLQHIGEETDLTGWANLAIDAWARTPGLHQGRFDEYHGLCERFVQSHLGNLATLTAAEEPITLHIGWAVLNCTPDRIDRVDGGDRDDPPTWERITDYKTEQGEMDHWFQISWYAQMRFLTNPSLERLDLVLDLIRWSRPHDPITVERGDLDEWWEATLAALRHRLDVGTGAPVGGPSCEGCALRRKCGEALPTIAIAPLNDAEADVLLSEHRRLDAAAKVRWGLLEEYYRDRDPRLDVNGEEIGYLPTRKPSFRWTAMPSAVAAWARRRSMDWRSFVALTTRSVSNRGVQELAVEDGVAEFAFNPPEFKTRKALVGTRRRKRGSGDGDNDRG
jgi:hypothetical protein